MTLDDADRDEVAELAAARGFEYRVRADRGRLKKAGNLRFGYEQSGNDVHRHLRRRLRAPAPTTSASSCRTSTTRRPASCSRPQFFDARTGMRWLQRAAGATQELFYRWIQPSRDAVRAPPSASARARSTGARRSTEAGGFAQIGHSEDVHTGVKLMKAGYKLRYVPILVSKGLCPDTLLGFLNQQYRWCTGSMSLLADQRSTRDHQPAAAALLLVGVPLLHHHRDERVRRGAARAGDAVAVPAGHLPAEHGLAARCDPALVLRDLPT